MGGGSQIHKWYLSLICKGDWSAKALFTSMILRATNPWLGQRELGLEAEIPRK